MTGLELLGFAVVIGCVIFGRYAMRRAYRPRPYDHQNVV